MLEWFSARGPVCSPSHLTTTAEVLLRADLYEGRWRRWCVAYTPDFEPIADALKRVMAGGMSEDEAKTDLCNAVADRKIDVRVTIATTGQLFWDGNVRVPPHLKPSDLDWVHSRPFAKWPIGPRPGFGATWHRIRSSLR